MKMEIGMKRSQEERDSYVEELHERVMEGDACALEELSGIAMGGASQLARELIDKIDNRADFDFAKSQE